MNKEFVLEDKDVLKDYMKQFKFLDIEIENIISIIKLEEMNFLKLLRNDWREKVKKMEIMSGNVAILELEGIIEKRAGKSLINTHPKEQENCGDTPTRQQCCRVSSEEGKVSSLRSTTTAPEGAKGCGKSYTRGAYTFTCGEKSLKGKIQLCPECKKKQEEKNEN